VRPSHPRVVSALARALMDKDREVRHLAAEALGRIGPRAASAVPALVAFLQKGEDAWGSVHPFCVIALPRAENLALLALSEMGAAARRAVPVLARMLAGATGKDKVAQLTCLGQLGSIAREVAPAIGRCLDDAKPAVRTYAAVALLCMEPDSK